jgi:DNA-binding HxlR family transcriptional regulator
MKIVKLDQPTRGSTTGRPVMVLLDLIGRRMALRILWELSRAEQPMTFRALQDVAETNPSLLNTRLKELREALLVIHDGDGYELSAHGKSFVALILPLVGWSEGWAVAVRRHAKASPK